MIGRPGSRSVSLNAWSLANAGLRVTDIRGLFDPSGRAGTVVITADLEDLAPAALVRAGDLINAVAAGTVLVEVEPEGVALRAQLVGLSRSTVSVNDDPAPLFQVVILHFLPVDRLEGLGAMPGIS